MSISDERLAELAAHEEIVGPLRGSMTIAEARYLVTELQSLSAAAKVRAIREGDGEGFPRLRTVRAHKHTCANVQPGSTIADKCDCGALDTAGNAIEIAVSPIPATGGEK